MACELRLCLDPWSAISTARSPALEFIHGTEPQVALRLTCQRILLNARLIRGQHQTIVPLTEVRDVTQVTCQRSYTSRVAGGKLFGKVEEHAVHVHHHSAIADFTNAWPFGIPTMLCIVAVGGLWQQVSMPFAFVEQLQSQASTIPTDSHSRSSFGSLPKMPPGPVTSVNCRRSTICHLSPSHWANTASSLSLAAPPTSTFS